MPTRFLLASLLSLIAPAFAQALPQTPAPQPGRVTAGNPVFAGWYADPEGAIFDKTYWIYPTYSVPYNEQTFMDAFSSPDLVH